MRKILPLYLFLFVLINLTSAQECLYKQALESYQQNDYSAAVSGFDAVITNPGLCPDVKISDVHYWRGWCRYYLGQLGEALEDFRSAESSLDNGLTAQYMRLYLSRQLAPNDEQVSEQIITELNSMLLQNEIPPSLKDRALFFRNLLRLQVGESLYRKNEIKDSQTYFQGIRTDETQITNRDLNEINDIVKSAALLWFSHEQLSQGNRLDKDVVDAIKQTKLRVADDATDDQKLLVVYYQSLLNLFTFLLENDYGYFLDAKNAMLSLDSQQEYIQDYRATINLLEENYNAVINLTSSDDPFSDYRRGWARFLRNNKSDKDLQRAASAFKASRDALSPCNSSLRKAAAFRYMQIKHFQDQGTQNFVEENLSSYFSKECLSDSAYIAEQQKWIDVFEQNYGFIAPNCNTGRGNLDIGLYKSVPRLVEKGKQHLFQNSCEIVQDDLLRAILLCIGDKPDFPKAIDILSKIVASKSKDIDEAKYALAMAYYNNDQVGNAIPLLDDLAKKGSLDASYKLANIHYDANDRSMACKMVNAIIQQQDVYTIYRDDAEQLYNLSQCGALGGIPNPNVSGEELVLRWPEYNVFAYDYIGQGVGIISKFYFEMKSEIVKFITPQAQLDFFNVDMLVPDAVLTAYINLTVQTPLSQPPSLAISANGVAMPEAVLIKSGDQYTYKSGPLDMGDYRIQINQKGSFGWLYNRFVAGNFEKSIVLDSAFVLNPRTVDDLNVYTNISQVESVDGRLVAFTPSFLSVDGVKYAMPAAVGVTSSVVQVDEAYYCLNAEKSKVYQIKLFSPDSVIAELFISGVYDSRKDVQEYREALDVPQKMIKIVYNTTDELFYILSTTGAVYEYSREGNCVSVLKTRNGTSFIIDAVYDKDEHCLWLLDVAANAIHKYEIGSGYNENAIKRIEADVEPQAIMVEESYIYIATAISEIQVYKKSNFRLLVTFSINGENEKATFSGFSLESGGLDSKRIIAVKRQSNENKIRSKNTVYVFDSEFDAGFGGED